MRPRVLSQAMKRTRVRACSEPSFAQASAIPRYHSVVTRLLSCAAPRGQCRTPHREGRRRRSGPGRWDCVCRVHRATWVRPMPMGLCLSCTAVCRLVQVGPQAGGFVIVTGCHVRQAQQVGPGPVGVTVIFGRRLGSSPGQGGSHCLVQQAT